MVSALLLLSLLTGAGGPAGVVRVARGPCTLDGSVLSSGTLLPEAAALETSAGGWMELQLLGVGRVRLSPSSRLVVGPAGLGLVAGRAWLQASEARAMVQLELGGVRVSAAPGTVAILASGPSTGIELAVIAGELSVLSGEQRLSVVAGRLATLPPGGRAVSRVGGEGLRELVALEAHRALGDLFGVRAFLLERVRAMPILGTRSPSSADLARQLAEVMGQDGDAVGQTLETSLRPPPFFEEEVPPKGPNVRVEVTFAGD